MVLCKEMAGASYFTNSIQFSPLSSLKVSLLEKPAFLYDWIARKFSHKAYSENTIAGKQERK